MTIPTQRRRGAGDLGDCIRREGLPQGPPVKQAAERLGVGRGRHRSGVIMTWKFIRLTVLLCVTFVVALFLAQPVTVSGQAKALTRSQKLKAHAKLYAHYQDGRSLRATHTSRIIEPGIVIETPSSPETFVQQRLCSADAVLLGDIEAAEGAFSEDESFIYTDYSLRVVEVIGTPRAGVLKSGDSIQVTRPGGTVLVDGVPHSVTVGDAPALRLGGRYLMALMYLPDTDSYRSGRMALFRVTNGVAAIVGRPGSLPESLRDVQWLTLRSQLERPACTGGVR
jgi:hypothetical protein